MKNQMTTPKRHRPIITERQLEAGRIVLEHRSRPDPERGGNLGSAVATLGYVNPQYHAEVVGNLSGKIVALQARLNAIAAIERSVLSRGAAGSRLVRVRTETEARATEVLARGTPARECARMVRKYGGKRDG